MRLLIVSEPGRYGVLMYVRELVAHLHEHHPHIIVDYAYSSRRGSPESEDLVTAIQRRGGATLDLRVGNGPEPGDLAAAWRLRKLVADRRHDLVHAHSSKAGALVRLLAGLPGFPPTLYTPHGYYGMARRGGGKERILNAVETALGRIGYTHNVSIHEREFARECLCVPADRLLLVFSGIDLDRFRPAGAGDRAAARKKLGIPADGRLLVTVGRDAYEKNFPELYAALDRVLPDARWMFAHAGAGAGALRDTLQSSVRGRVHAFEFLADPETLYRAADGFVLVSRSEAFGLAAYEALACGLPLVLTATMGLLSLRELGFSGIRWLPDPAVAGNISAEIAAALLAWSDTPAGDPFAQRDAMEKWFDAAAQFDKVARICQALAAGESPAAKRVQDRAPGDAPRA